MVGSSGAEATATTILRSRLDVLQRLSLARRELVVTGLLLLLVAASVFGTYVRDGGFNDDDWLWSYTFRDLSSRVFHAQLHARLTTRPGGLVYFVPVFSLSGGRMWIPIAAGMLLGIVAVLAFYVLLRELQVERVHATALAVLALVFPFSNAVMIWPTAGAFNLAVSLYLLGLVLSLRALRRQTSHPRALHAAAIGCWALSLATYETALTAMLLAVLLYGTVAPWRRALRHALVDYALLVPALLFVLLSKLHAGAQHLATDQLVGIHGGLVHLKAMVTQSFSLLAPVVYPYGWTSSQLAQAANENVVARATGLWPLAALAVPAAALLVLRHRPRSETVELRRWLRVLGGSALGIAAAYLVFLPAPLGYVPLAQGMNNHTNIVARFGWVVAAYALAMLAARLVAMTVRRPRLARALAGLLLAGLLAGYVRVDRRDVGAWAAAYRQEQAVLATVEAAFPRPPRDATFYLLLPHYEVAPGVRVFIARSDLWGALGLHYPQPPAAALPLEPGSGRFVCSTRVRFDPLDPELRIDPSPYSRTLAVQYPGGRHWRLSDPDSCRAFARYYDAWRSPGA